MRFSIILTEYENYLTARNYSVTTIKIHHRILKRFYEYLSSNKFSLQMLTNEIMSSYVDHLKSSGKHSHNYVYDQICTIKSFYRFLYRYKYIKDNPILEYSFIRHQKMLPKNILTEKEMRKFLESIPESRYKVRDTAILELYYATGMRLSELINLDIDSIDFTRNLIFIRQGKGKKDRYVPVTDYALNSVKKYIAELRDELLGTNKTKALFLGATGRRINDNRIGKIFKEVRTRSKINKNVTPHTMRHCFATHLLQEGANIRNIQEMLSHEDIGTTEKYTRVNLYDLARIIKMYHPLENELYRQPQIQLPGTQYFSRKKGFKRNRKKV